MPLEGEKVHLEHITKDYTDLIIKWRNNESTRTNFIFQEEFTNFMHNAWIDSQVNTGKVVQFIIWDKSTESPVGSVYLRDIDKANEKAEYGIFIGEENARGKGLGTEAANIICEYGFHELHLHKIMLRVFANNISAIKSYTKAGFIQEAYLKDDVKIKDEYKDIVLMSMIKD